MNDHATSLAKPGQAVEAVPPDASGVPWAIAGAALVDEWMADFTWGTVPLNQYISHVDVAVNGDSARTLWRSAHPAWSLPAHPPLAGLPPLDDALFNMGHPVWLELADAWRLEGRWLHPETRFSIDQLTLAEIRAGLLIGCRDRSIPTAARRYDPQRDPVLTDQGLIAFPLRGWRAAELLYDGHGAEAAMLLCAGTALAEAAVHEAFEMHQSAPGQPVLDPHTPGVRVDVLVRWRWPWGARDRLRARGLIAPAVLARVGALEQALRPLLGVCASASRVGAGLLRAGQLLVGAHGGGSRSRGAASRIWPVLRVGPGGR
ncbi:MAG TPA: hypothetical protein VN520_06675 [Streptomyces sp.]|uniref:hypothetical protein n=1 Tax=Streptomyces sp. TaxID=1931 RepID=UPI002C4874F0|nr:hypothetical protein [Streptomyces sp.]HWU06064.1 hypothetical protein [Streptomyces sp.]